MDDIIYSINNVIHIQNDNDDLNHILITNSKTALYNHFNDNSIAEQLRIIGGAWLDDMIVRNIFAHNDNQELGNGLLNIGNNKTDILSLNSSNIHLETSKIFDINKNKETRFLLDSLENSISIGTSNLNNFQIEGKNINIGNNSKINLDGILYLKQNKINKIFYNNGELMYLNTNTESICESGIYLSWDIEKIKALINPSCYTFRVTCKFHATNNGGDTMYCHFSIMVNPKIDEYSNYPGQITITEKHETYNTNCKIEDIVIIRITDNKVFVSIKWKNKNIINNITIPHIDIEIFANDKIGNITIEKYGSILEGNGTVSIDS